MDNTYAPTAPTQEKIKVESIDIVVTGPKKKPYYTIKCRKIGSNDDCIGFGSYCLENVIRWKEQCFELVERKSDWIPISERLPDTDEYVLLSFENYTMAAIGRYEENDEGGTFYPGDDEKILFKLWIVCKCLDVVAGTIQGGAVNACRSKRRIPKNHCRHC